MVVVKRKISFHDFKGLCRFRRNIPDCRLDRHRFKYCLVRRSISTFQSSIDSKFGHLHIGFKSNTVSLFLTCGFQNILSFDFCVFNLQLEFIWKRERSELEELDFMPSRISHSRDQIIFHLFLNHCSVLEKIVRSKIGCGITDDIDNHPCEDSLLSWTIRCVNLENVFRLNSVL